MKYIKFFLSDKSTITMDEPQAKEFLNGQNQIFAIKERGVWTGEVINKAFIVRSCRDKDEEKYFARKNNVGLPEPEFKPVADIDKYKPDSIRTLSDSMKVN